MLPTSGSAEYKSPEPGAETGFRQCGVLPQRAGSASIASAGTDPVASLTSIATAFCACAACCGEGRSGETASGRKPVVGVTVAAPRSIPFGTWVNIDVPGYGVMRRRVDDRTSRRFDGRWDVFMASHGAAARFGVRKCKVTIIP